MRPFIQILAAASLTAFFPAAAWAQDAAPSDPEMETLPAPDRAQGDWEETYAPPAPQATEAAPAGQDVPSGEWVWTQQYGWVWMPYADGYTYVPPDGAGEPSMYVYYPAYGWTWVVAPWIWGWGPWPRFGGFGPAHFAWYGHGWWRTPGRWRGTTAPFHGGFGGRGGGRAFPARQAPSRGVVPHRAGVGFQGGGRAGLEYRGGFTASGAPAPRGGPALASGGQALRGGGGGRWGGGHR
jgi:hypothetical protein